MMMKKTILNKGLCLFFSAFFLVQIAGCAGMEAAEKIMKVIKDPNIQVGKEDAQPTQVSFSLVGEDELNLNYDGESTPVLFDVYELKDDARFLAADYDNLAENAKKVLGRNYVKHEEYSIEPSGYKHIKEFPLDGDTEFLGVVAHYTDIDEVLWKRIVKVSPKGERLHFLILLKDKEVKLDRMDE